MLDEDLGLLNLVDNPPYALTACHSWLDSLQHRIPILALCSPGSRPPLAELCSPQLRGSGVRSYRTDVRGTAAKDVEAA
jgi:hypothetical protein